MKKRSKPIPTATYIPGWDRYSIVGATFTVIGGGNPRFISILISKPQAGELNNAMAKRHGRINFLRISRRKDLMERVAARRGDLSRTCLI